MEARHEELRVADSEEAAVDQTWTQISQTEVAGVSALLHSQHGRAPTAMEIEEYFNSNGVGALGVSEPQSGSSNSYYVGFALAAALIQWMRRKQDEDDDTLFIK